MSEDNVSKLRQAYRRIHMDFHNPDFLCGVGKNFDAKKYVTTLKEANINGLVIFSKCHHGNSYYRTNIGKIHPGLDKDMMGEILEECTRQRIITLIYYSVAWDRSVAQRNRDWLQKTKEGESIAHRVWEFICLNSPYKEEVVFPQLREIIQNYEGFIGFWLDIVRMAPEGCYCDYCQRKFRAEYGHSIEEASDSERYTFLNKSTIDFFQEAKKVIKQENPNLLVTFNQASLFNAVKPDPTPGAYNKLWRVVDFVSVESHTPDYGDVPRTSGILDASFKAKYCKGFGVPFEITLSRFIHSWGAWDILPLAHFKTVFSQIAVNGGLINCGDQAYPDGTLDKGVYSTLGKAFQFLMKREEYFRDKEEVPNVCILADRWGSPFRAAGQMISQLQVPYTIRDTNQIKENGLESYRTVICPELGALDEKMLEILLQYVEGGGTLLADYSVPFTQGGMFRKIFGASYLEQSPYTVGYLDMSSFKNKDDLFNMPLIVTGGPFAKIEVNTARKIASWIYPQTETTKERYLRHPNPPPGTLSPYPGAILNKVGKGRALFIAAPLFRDYWESCHWYLKLALKIFLQELDPEPILQIEGDHPDLEVALTKSRDAIQIHLITYEEAPKTKRFSLIENNPTIHNLNIYIVKDLIGSPRKAYVAPEGDAVSWKEAGNYIKFTLPKVKAYNVLVIQK